MSTYIPGQIPDDPAQLPDFLRREFLSLKQSQERATPYLRLAVTTIAPLKVQDGDLYEAGTGWNPGSGNGLYLRRAGAWIRLG